MKLLIGFALGFFAAFVVVGFARRPALEAEFDPYAKPFGDWPYIPFRPNGYDEVWPTVRNFTEEVH